MKKIKVYVASPYFNDNEKNRLDLLRYLWETWKKKEYDFYFPFDHKIKNAWDYTEEEWAKKVFKMDIKAIKKCDEVWVLNYGLYSDSGTAWEVGYAYGLGKKIKNILIENESKTYSLMMMNGSTEIVCPFKYKQK